MQHTKLMYIITVFTSQTNTLTIVASPPAASLAARLDTAAQTCFRISISGSEAFSSISFRASSILYLSWLLKDKSRASVQSFNISPRSANLVCLQLAGKKSYELQTLADECTSNIHHQMINNIYFTGKGFLTHISYLSIAETNLVRKLFLDLNFSDTCPLNKSFFATRSMQASLAISPRYIPDIIFSNLRTKWRKLSLSFLQPFRPFIRDSLKDSLLFLKSPIGESQ